MIITDLPNEVLDPAFRYLRSLSQTNVYKELRLVCYYFHSIATPLCFETFTFPLVVETEEDSRSLQSTFDKHRRLIRSLMIPEGRSVSGLLKVRNTGNISTFLVPDDVRKDIIRRCGNLRHLSCLGGKWSLGQDGAFSYPGWLEKCAPRLSSTLVSLQLTLTLFDGCSQLSHALMDLGPRLRSLDIRKWTLRRQLPETQTFDLPPALPQLNRLTLTEGSPHMKHLSELFSRIVADPSISQSETPDVPLRSLSIIAPRLTYRCLPVSIPDLLTLLSINRIGEHLTELCIQNNLNFQILDLYVSPVCLLHACPNLISFAYRHYLSDQTSSEVVRVIPRTLEILELQMPHHDFWGGIKAWVRDEGGTRSLGSPALREFHIHTSGWDLHEKMQMVAWSTGVAEIEFTDTYDEEIRGRNRLVLRFLGTST